MKLNFVSAGYTATCRRCNCEHHKAVTVYPDTGIPLGDAIELAVHQDAEDAGWTDGLCPECGNRVFLDEPLSPPNASGMGREEPGPPPSQP